jgi:hypothetical protein
VATLALRRLIAAAFLTALTGAGAAVAASTTKVAVYRPFASGKLRSGLVVVHRLRGSCWTSSLAVTRPDAWRCAVGNEILDPCFGGALGAGVVACVADPFSKAVDVLVLTKSLPQPDAAQFGNAGGEPWVIRLTNGDQCTYASGFTGAVAGMRLNYECKRGGWLIGHVRRRSGLWSILSYAHALLRPVTIDSAVF